MVATTLSNLGPSFQWTNAHLPINEVIVILDTMDIPGAFFLTHFSSLFTSSSSSPSSVCFLGFQHSKAHYVSIIQKLGGKCNDLNFHYIDGFTRLFCPDWTLAQLLESVSLVIARSPASSPVAIIMDDLRSMELAFGSEAVYYFFRSCRDLVVQADQHLCLIVLDHADVETSESGSSSLCSRHWATNVRSITHAIQDLASVIIDVSPLETGIIGTNVHGSVRLL